MYKSSSDFLSCKIFDCTVTPETVNKVNLEWGGGRGRASNWLTGISHGEARNGEEAQEGAGRSLRDFLCFLWSGKYGERISWLLLPCYFFDLSGFHPRYLTPEFLLIIERLRWASSVRHEIMLWLLKPAPLHQCSGCFCHPPHPSLLWLPTHTCCRDHRHPDTRSCQG